jgi:hypothetical protein
MSKPPRGRGDSSKEASQDGPKPPPQPPPLRDPAAALAALGALYQGEKTDASYIFNTAMAMMGVAVAYLVGAIGFVGTIRHGPLAWVFLLLLPMPLWIIIAFHSLVTLNAMSHGISVQIIEQELFDASELSAERKRVGSAAGDRIMDINVSKVVHKITTVFVYLGIGLLVVGFTYYVLDSAYDVIKLDPTLLRYNAIWTAAVIYALLLVMVGSSWVIGLRDVGAGRKELANHVRRFGVGGDAGS